jgi:hypothetical protein
LRDLYKQDTEKYTAGLLEAAGKDYEVGYRDWAQNRATLLNILLKNRDFRNQKDLLKASQEFSAEQNRLGREHQAGESEKSRIHQTGESEKSRKSQDAKFYAQLAETKRQHDAQNAINLARTGVAQQNANARHKTGALAGVSTRTGRIKNAQAKKGVKTVIFPAAAGMPGAEADPTTGQYNIYLNLTPDEYKAIEYMVRSGKAVPQKKVPGVVPSKLKGDEAIKFYVQQVNPELLYDGSGNMPIKAFWELLKNPESGLFYGATESPELPDDKDDDPENYLITP